MSLLDRLGEIAKSAATTDLQLKQLHEELDTMSRKVDILGNDLYDLRERVTRLEAQREADRAQMATEIERFKLEVERAELRLTRQLPPQTSVE